MSGTLISASYGEEDQSLGIKFTQVKAYGDTIHIMIDALRPELQQKFPQLRSGLILHEVNGQSQHGKEWSEVSSTLQRRPLELTFIASIAELHAMTAFGNDGARAMVHARDGFLGRKQHSNNVVPAHETGLQSAAMMMPGESPPSIRSQSLGMYTVPRHTVSDSGRSRAISEGGSMSLVSDFEPDSPGIYMSEHLSLIASKLDRQYEDAGQDALRIKSELEQVEAQISNLQLLAEPSASDPVQTLAARGAASAAAADAGVSGTGAATRHPYPHALSVRARVPSARHPIERAEFFVQHKAVVDTLQDFQRRMSTLDVVQVPVAFTVNGRQPWSVSRTIDEEIERIQHDIQRLLDNNGGSWVGRQEFLAHVLHQAAELCQERPAHLRRLTGVAKVSLDNRFSRRVVDRLAQLLHEMNIEIITELRRETARDTAAAAGAFDASARGLNSTPPSYRNRPPSYGTAGVTLGAAVEQSGTRHVSTLHDEAVPPGVAEGSRSARAPGDHQ